MSATTKTRDEDIIDEDTTIDLDNPEDRADLDELAESTNRLVVDLRRAAVDSGFAVVGITDIAVERIRDYQLRVNEVREDITSRSVSDELVRLREVVSNLPSDTFNAGVEAAERAEENFEELATRGRDLVERIVNSESGQALIEQAQNLMARIRGLQTSVERTVEETTESGRRVVKTVVDGAEDIIDEVEDAAEDIVDEVEETAKAATRTARRTSTRAKSQAKKTAKAAQKRTSSTRSAAKGAATSARKTAAAAGSAVEENVEKIGETKTGRRTTKTAAAKSSAAKNTDAVTAKVDEEGVEVDVKTESKDA